MGDQSDITIKMSSAIYDGRQIDSYTKGTSQMRRTSRHWLGLSNGLVLLAAGVYTMSRGGEVRILLGVVAVLASCYCLYGFFVR